MDAAVLLGPTIATGGVVVVVMAMGQTNTNQPGICKHSGIYFITSNCQVEVDYTTNKHPQRMKWS